MLELLLELATRYTPGEILLLVEDASALGLEGNALGQLICGVCSYQARAQPEAALAAAMALRDGQHRQMAVLGVAQGWAEADPDAAMVWLRQASPEEQAFGHQPVMERVARRNPQAAWQFVLDTRNAAFWDGRAIAPIIAALKPQSEQELESYLEQLGRDDVRGGRAREAIYRHMAVDDPEFYLEFAATAGPESMADYASRIATRRLVDRDLDEARRRLPEMTEGLQIHLAPAIVSEIAKREGLDAALDYLDTVESDRVYNSAVLRVADDVALVDPREAVKLARYSPDSGVRATLTDAGYSAWTARDPQKAWETAMGESDAQLRIWAMEAVLSAEVEIDPASAFAKLFASGDEGLLQDMMLRSYPRVVRRNRSLAQEIAEQLPEGSAHRMRADGLLAR